MVPTVPAEELLGFVRSRIPMVEHDLRYGLDDAPPMGKARRRARDYCMQQAFFYQAEWWIKRPPRVSKRALEHASENWGRAADEIWTLRRDQIAKVEGRPISKCGLIYEHVFTGWMFRDALIKLAEQAGGKLDPDAVAQLLHDHFQTAWIHREEDTRLNRAGYRSKRGATLTDALGKYSECGIEFVDPPASELPPETSDTPFDALSALAEDESEAPTTGRGAVYDRFFAKCEELLSGIPHAPRVRPNGGRRYVSLVGSKPKRGVPGVVISLSGPRGGKWLSPIIGFELRNDRPEEEPTSPDWQDLRASLGEDWSISFGKAEEELGRLCRCTKQLATGFSVDPADETEICESACAAVAELLTLWPTLSGGASGR